SYATALRRVDGPGYSLSCDAIRARPFLERPRLRVDVTVAAEELSRDQVAAFQVMRLRRIEVDLGLHPAIRVAVDDHARHPVVLVGCGGVEDAILEQQRVTGVEAQ